MKKIIFDWTGSVREVMAAFREEQSFCLLLHGWKAGFIGPYVAFIMRDATRQLTRTAVVERVSVLGWVLRALWLPSLGTYYEIAKEKRWSITLIDRDKEGFEIRFDSSTVDSSDKGSGPN